MNFLSALEFLVSDWPPYGSAYVGREERLLFYCDQYFDEVNPNEKIKSDTKKIKLKFLSAMELFYLELTSTWLGIQWITT